MISKSRDQVVATATILASLLFASPGLAKKSAADIDLNKIQVSIDTRGFAQKTERQINKGVPSEPLDELIFLNGQPRSIRILFDGETVPFDNDHHKKHLLVFPLKEYTDLYNKEIDRKKAFADNIKQLKDIIASGSVKGVQDIPLFPWGDAAQLVHAQERVLKFKNGAGVAFVATFGNGDAALTENSQVYCFQGLTDDGLFYVSFFAPIKTPGLPAGVPMSIGASRLAQMPHSAFKPDLNILDNMLKTLSIK